VERIVVELAPDPAKFAEHFELVRAFVSRQPGAHSALMAAANQDPEAVTTSIVALGAVLLDIAAAAFHLSPDDMMTKLASGVTEITDAAAADDALSQG
jgi:hypothetical protein